MTSRDAATRPIWLCADDYGIAPGVNVAIRDLVLRGRLNATSVMSVAPAFDRSEAAALAALNADGPRVAIGLHVTFTAPFKPLSDGFATLRDGAFLPLGATLQAALLRRFDAQQLAAEVAAQLAAFIAAFGRPPDFLDGHQHVQLFPQIRDAVMAVARRSAPQAWLRQCGRSATPLPQRLMDRKGLLLDLLSRSFRHRTAELGIATNAGFAGTYDFDTAPDFARLFPTFIAGLPQDGLVMCHPGFVDAELCRLDPLTDLREREYAYLIGDEFLPALAAQGVALK
jgi:predicted glycoside hydrolase/deacetylase ChbG (UPF0249 family)